MRIAAIQMDTAWESPETNYALASFRLEEAAHKGAQVAVLPETFATGFSMLTQGIEPEDGRTARFLSQEAQRLKMYILAGFKARTIDADRKHVNVAHTYDPTGAIVGRYVKLHPFPLSGEDKAFSPGKGPAVFWLDKIAASVFICYDLRFPESFRAVAHYVSVIFVIANWPVQRQDHWQTLLKARAIENQCYVVGVNRVGSDKMGIAYAGGSAAYGPFGEEVMLAGPEEGAFVFSIDESKVKAVREQYPFLKDMR